MYKCLNGLILDRNIVEMFSVLALQHGANTRANRRNDLIIMQTRTGMGDRAFSVFGARIWNSLPLDVRSSNSTRVFTSYWNLQALDPAR